MAECRNGNDYDGRGGAGGYRVQMRHERPADSRGRRARCFAGSLPRARVLQRDLDKAGIPKLDTQGRRLDMHALRKTNGTLLQVNGAFPRVTMELMRHSDIKLTMREYTDAQQLPLAQAVNSLPTFTMPSTRDTQTPDVSGQEQSPLGVTSLATAIAQVLDSAVVGRKKAPRVVPGRFIVNGAGEETRTLDVHLGKVVLYQLSYSREGRRSIETTICPSTRLLSRAFTRAPRISSFP